MSTNVTLARKSAERQRRPLSPWLRNCRVESETWGRRKGPPELGEMGSRYA